MSDYLEKLIGKAQRRDFWDDLPEKFTPPAPEERHAVRRDSFDKSAWDQTIGQIPALRRQVEELTETYPTSRAAYEDLFNLLNQGDPRFTEMESMVPEYRPQHAMLNAMSQADDFQWIRNETKYDEYNTALAMLTMDDRMRDAFDTIKDAMELIEQLEQALQEALEQAQEALANGAGVEETDQVCQGLRTAMQAVADAEDAEDDAIKCAGEILVGGLGEVRDEIDRQTEQAQNFGKSKGQLKRMSYEERRKLAERLDKNRMAKLAKLIGQFRMFGDVERRRRVKHAPAEVIGVTLGNDLTKLAPQELTNLAVPELEDPFWLRWAKHQLLQWEVQGPEQAGKGPIIVVCDESGSMGCQLDDLGNTREAWSKAVSLALCDQARRDKRDFTYIGFASQHQQWETTLVGGQAPIEQVIEFTEHFLGGGTEYTTPLTRAMEIIGSYEQAGKPKPDVVFITDAECSVPPQFIERWNEVKDRADVRCFGVQIGGSGRYTDMEKLVDRLIAIDQLNASPEGMQELFRGI